MTTIRMPDRAWGVELEVMAPANTEGYRDPDRYRAAEILGQAGIKARAYDYTHEVTRLWKVVPDGSVRDGFEIVSPILTGLEGLAEVEKVCKTLTSAGYSVNSYCGLHVHVDARDFDRKALIRLVRQFLIEEHNLDKFVDPARLSNTYCKSNLAAFNNMLTRDKLKVVKRAYKEIRNSAQHIANKFGSHQDDQRYHKLNLAALWRHHTIEYRAHEGCLDPVKVARWIRTCVLFTCGAIHVRNDSIKCINKMYVDTTPEETLARFEKRAFRKGRRRKLAGGALNPMRRRVRNRLPVGSVWLQNIQYDEGQIVGHGYDLFRALCDSHMRDPYSYPTHWQRLACSETGERLERCLCDRHVTRRGRIQQQSALTPRPDVEVQPTPTPAPPPPRPSPGRIYASQIQGIWDLSTMYYADPPLSVIVTDENE